MPEDQPKAHDALLSAHNWLEAGRDVVMATVMRTWGSASVPVGGQLAILNDSQFAGSVSGGCVEAEVLTEAADIRGDSKHRVLNYGVSDEDAWSVGLTCGGRISILLQPLSAQKDAATLKAIRDAVEARQPCLVAIDVQTGAMTFHTAHNTAQTDTQFATSDAQGTTPSAYERALKTGESTLETIAERDVFLHAFVPPPRIVIVGATHIAVVLAGMARDAGYQFVVVDPRESFANASRFPGIDVRVAWPNEILPELLDDTFAALVTLTHAEHIDDQALAAGLRSPCRYIGALGSRRTHASRVQRLQTAGFSDTDISRIHAPIGLDLGGRAAGEIAVAILAQIVQTFRKNGATQTTSKTVVT